MFFVRLFDSDLDVDDNNSIVSEFSESGDFEIEAVDSSGVDEDWCLITVTTAQADEVCITLDKLICNGVISKEKKICKCLKDTLEYLCSPLHHYDDTDVKEFFASVAYLGGYRTCNFIRGPMEYGREKCLNKNNLSNATECRMNLRASSSETIRKLPNPYIRKSEVLKYLRLPHHKLFENSCDPNVEQLVLTDNLIVYTVDFGNDGTALKPPIQFDERAKVNMGLEDKIRWEYVKENPYLSEKELEHGIVTEIRTLVSSITTLDNNCYLPVAVKYSTKTSLEIGMTWKPYLQNK